MIKFARKFTCHLDFNDVLSHNGSQIWICLDNPSSFLFFWFKPFCCSKLTHKKSLNLNLLYSNMHFWILWILLQTISDANCPRKKRHQNQVLIRESHCALASCFPNNSNWLSLQVLLYQHFDGEISNLQKYLVLLTKLCG